MAIVVDSFTRQSRLKQEFATDRKFARPIFVDLGQLKRLDEIIDKYRERLHAENQKLIDKKVESRFNEYHAGPGQTPEQIAAKKLDLRKSLEKDGLDRIVRELTINLTHGRQLEVANFTEAAEHPGLDREIPAGFALEYRLVPFKIQISLNTWTEELLINTSPNDSELSQAIFGSLSHWAKDVMAPIWLRTWFRVRFVVWALFWTWLCTAPFFLLSNRQVDVNKEKAHKLLEHGIDSSNQAQAISLILAIQSEHESQGPSKPISARAWFYLISITSLLILLSLCPGMAIGLWAGKHYLTACRWWTKFVVITLPLFVFGAFIRPSLISWLSKLF